MRLVTKNIIRRIFQDIATAFYQINSFGYGPADEFVQKTMDENDQELEGTIIYPRLYVTPEPSTITGKRINRNYTIVVADLVRKGRENMTEAESDTEQILTDVIAQIQDQAYGFQLDISSISIVPFTGRFVDEVTGHYAEVSLYSGFEFDRCQIPSEFISISNPYIPLDEEGTNERDPLSWHKTGNTLTASSVIGSNNDQDWRIIHNNVTIGTVQAIGLTINGAIDYTSGAIQSLNGLTAKSQVFAVGSSGTDFNLVSAAGVHTFNIPDAGVGITGGLVNNAAQTFEGVKTFASAPILTGFTEGSVLFVGVGGVVSQDFAGIAFDATGNRLAINRAYITGTTLGVNGSGATSTSWTAQFHNSTGANNALMIRDDGFIGVGNAAPEQKLHVSGDILIGNYSSSTNLLRFANVSNSGNSAFIGGSVAGSRFEINPGSISEFRVQIPTGGDALPLNFQGNSFSTHQWFRDGRQIAVVTRTATANNDYGWNFTGTLTARATAGDTLAGTYLTPTLVAAANNQRLVAHRIAGTFTNGAFTGVVNIGLELGNSLLLGRLAADPTTAENGMIYYNSVTNKFRGYEGGAWANLI